jgi:thymidylate synthase (FAD)
MTKLNEEKLNPSAIAIKDDFDVILVEWAGDDELICKAARVSTIGAKSIDSKESSGLINFLMKNRHGSPFEHSMMTFRISAPIFVWREFMRHRIGISYNEQSGRYMELEPVFYIPDIKRNLIQTGKPGHYIFVPGTPYQYQVCIEALRESYLKAWVSYQEQLKVGIANEVARLCLPVGIYSTAYVTMNPRSIMHFLSLRTKHEGSTFPSFPMWEINDVANQMEGYFRMHFSLTWEAFNKNGRVSP